jgi:hypothetical protein
VPVVEALDMPDDHLPLADGTSRPNYGDPVIRRSFRFGLALGLLGGLAAALAKILGTRTDPVTATAPAAPSAPWPPLVVDEGARPASPPQRTPLTPATGQVPVEPALAEDDPVADLGLVLPDVTPAAVEPVEPPAAAPAPAPAAAPAPAPRARKAPLKAATPAPTPAPTVKRSAPAKKAAPPADAPAPAPAPPARKATKAPAKAAAKTTKAGKKAAPPVTWVEPLGDVCPTTHPVKAKMASLIFHVPGGLNYPRTRPDRCYLDTSAAEADGLRPAKR